jgi:HAD superfamily hydrolase (TIGR01549 family)
MDSAVIFDVDGVLLELTREEEELFFIPFSKHLDATLLSRDWNSYRIRKDEEIINEIIEMHNLPESERHRVKVEYLTLLTQSLKQQSLVSTPITGAAHLMSQLAGRTRIGIATANFRDAARFRLEAANLWHPVSELAFGAEGGGHKSQILGRALAAINLPKSKVVYVGDNLNDLQAGKELEIHFIGFSTDPDRREILCQAGADHVTSSHQENLALISAMLALGT